MRQGGGCGTVIVLLILGAAVFQCSRSDRAGPEESAARTYGEDSSELSSWDGDGAPSADIESRGAEAFDAMASSSYTLEGMPYGCTDDCSGHEAGWRWAADNLITDPYMCGGNSQSFVAGCQAFAEAVQARAEE